MSHLKSIPCGTERPFLLSLSEPPLPSVHRLAATSEVGDLPWKFYFKLYCFLDTDNVPKDSVEFAFMFEQVEELSETDSSAGEQG